MPISTIGFIDFVLHKYVLQYQFAPCSNKFFNFQHRPRETPKTSQDAVCSTTTTSTTVSIRAHWISPGFESQQCPASEPFTATLSVPLWPAQDVLHHAPEFPACPLIKTPSSAKFTHVATFAKSGGGAATETPTFASQG